MVLSGTASYLQTLAETYELPVVYTLMGKGAIPDGWEYNLGMLGMHGSYAANMAVTDCDLLLTVGARFDDRVTGSVANFAPNARILHFDIDKVEINKIVHADISVNGDLRWSLPLLLENWRPARPLPSTGCLAPAGAGAEGPVSLCHPSFQ